MYRVKGGIEKFCFIRLIRKKITFPRKVFRAFVLMNDVCLFVSGGAPARQQGASGTPCCIRVGRRVALFCVCRLAFCL